LKKVKEEILKHPHITYKGLKEISSWGIFSMIYKRTSVNDSRYDSLKIKVFIDRRG